MWEATAGESALQGEDPIICALRELSEETGIKADKLTEDIEFHRRTEMRDGIC